MMALSICLAIIAACVWILYRRSLYTVFTKAGIPGPKPSIFFGNLLELSSKNPMVCHREWVKKYGDVVGYYMGTQPCVIINNPDLLKKIQISEFHAFPNRPKILNTAPWRKETGDYSNQLVVLKNKRWKDVRSLLTPTFTTIKMKQMAPIIHDSVDIFMDKIDKEATSGRSFDIYEMYQALTLDIIGRTAFGIQTDVQRNEKDSFLQACSSFFAMQLSSSFLILMISFPEFFLILHMLMNLYMRILNGGTDPIKDICAMARKVVESRRRPGANRRHDALQLMIDAQATEANATNEELTAGDDDADEVDKTDSTSGSSSSTSSIKSKFQLSEGEIVDNVILFFFAGYETTSTALAFTTHFLVHYPETQEKIRAEANRLLEKGEEIDYLAVQQLPYLSQVIKESLRMYPPVYQFVGREVKDDVVLDGYRFQKGVALVTSAYILHHDDRYWENPDVFNPDRFSSENKSGINPLAYQAFGAGPRNCIGMRFAMMEAKLALIRILSKYKLEKCPDTDKLDIELRISNVLTVPKNGVILKAVRI